MPKTLNILVVDDDVDNANSLGELFAMEGHSVCIVHSGEEAIEAYLTQNFDLAFMDVMMPGKNGVESFLEIKSKRPGAGVYMMTGYSVEELLQQAMRGGALGVLEKPFDTKEVLRLTHAVGPGGLVVSATGGPSRHIGRSIQSALQSGGLSARLIRELDGLAAQVSEHEVVVIDANLPLIDEVSVFSALRNAGHAAQTIIVPPRAAVGGQNIMRNVRATGVLNKPYDPAELLRRLPELAA